MKEESESVTVEDPSGTDENSKTDKIDYMVSKESVAALKNNRTLSDDNFNTLQNMLNREYPHINGRLDPVLGQALQFKVIVRTGYLH